MDKRKKKLTSSPYISTYVLFGQNNTNCRKKVIFHDKTNCMLFQIAKTNCTRREVPLGTAIGNEELMHECSPNHTRKGKARLKEDEENR